jgi:hypothetical protein
LPDWLPGVIIAAIAAIPACWGLIQGRRKVDAEAGKVTAEAEAAIVSAYKLLVADLRDDLDVARQGVRLREEEVQGLKETIAVLFEQKMHAEAMVTALTARLAYYEGRPLYNANDLNDEIE